MKAHARAHSLMDEVRRLAKDADLPMVGLIFSQSEEEGSQTVSVMGAMNRVDRTDLIYAASRTIGDLAYAPEDDDAIGDLISLGIADGYRHRLHKEGVSHDDLQEPKEYDPNETEELQETRDMDPTTVTSGTEVCTSLEDESGIETAAKILRDHGGDLLGAIDASSRFPGLYGSACERDSGLAYLQGLHDRKEGDDAS